MSTCTYSERIDEFALGGLSDLDRMRMLEHIRMCAECARSAGDAFESLSTIALNVPQIDPPASLRRVILADAERIKESESVRLTRPSAATGRRWAVHWPAAMAASVAAVSLVWSVRLSSDLEKQRSDLTILSRRYDTIVGVLASSDVTIRTLAASSAAPGAMGRIYIDPSTGDGMIMHRLPPLPEGSCYQLWFVRDGERVDGGILRTNPDGSGYTLIHAPGPIQQFDGVGVTREPVGGSRWPTTDRLIGSEI